MFAVVTAQTSGVRAPVASKEPVDSPGAPLGCGRLDEWTAVHSSVSFYPVFSRVESHFRAPRSGGRIRMLHPSLHRAGSVR